MRAGVVFLAQKDLLASVLLDSPNLVVKEFAETEDLEKAVAKRNMDFGIIWDGTRLTFLFNRGRIQDNPEFAAKAREIIRRVELRIAGLSPLIVVEKTHVGKLSAANWFHYIVPGLMAMALIQTGVFAIAGRVAGMRELGILKPMLVAPLSGWSVLLGVGLVRMSLGLASAGLLLLFARTVFAAEFLVDFGLLIFYALVCGLGAMGLGAVLSIVARKPGTAAAAGMILVQTMLFLSGIYIPFEFLPAGLQAVGQIFPAYHMAQGMRAALGVVEQTPPFLWAGLGFGAFGFLSLIMLGRVSLRPE